MTNQLIITALLCRCDVHTVMSSPVLNVILFAYSVVLYSPLFCSLRVNISLILCVCVSRVVLSVPPCGFSPGTSAVGVGCRTPPQTRTKPQNAAREPRHITSRCSLEFLSSCFFFSFLSMLSVLVKATYQNR